MNSRIKKSPKQRINKLVFEQNYENSIKLDINENFAIFSTRLMAVDDEADITFTLKKESEQSGFLLGVFNDPIVGFC